MRAQAFVNNPKEAVRQHHESSPRQMLLILRQLNPPDSLWALLNWINGPPHDKVTLSLVIRIRNVDDTEAEFLLKSISHCRKAYTDADVAEELSRLLNNANRKREFKPPTILTTEDDRSFLADALLDCGCTDTAINRSFVEKEGIPVKKLPFPRNSMNADGTENKNGHIMSLLDLMLMVMPKCDICWFLTSPATSISVLIGSQIIILKLIGSQAKLPFLAVLLVVMILL
jgi:hypothetical protein